MLRGIAQFSKSSTNSQNGGSVSSELSSEERYKILYERECEENERLRQQIEELNLRVKKEVSKHCSLCGLPNTRDLGGSKWNVFNKAWTFHVDFDLVRKRPRATFVREKDR